MQATSFQVARKDLHTQRWEALEAPTAPNPGEVLVTLTRCAFTANNVTYARLGDQIPYWKFYPVPEPWGRIPVWGVGKIARSAHEQYREGETVYGFFPMDSHAVLRPAPGDIKGARFLDASPHRQGLPPVYNEYVLLDRDPTFDRKTADAHLVLRPLFSLSFFCAAFLQENEFFGARQVILTSASSKTGLGLAMMLRLLGKSAAIKIVGLTSSGNVDFVRDSGLFDAVYAYSDVGQLPQTPSVLVDLGGDAAIRAAVHHRLGDDIRHSALAGFTHWEALGKDDGALPGAKPTLFFTPDHILRLRQQWVHAVLRARLAEGWSSYLEFVGPWLQYRHTTTRDGIEQVYAEVLAGKVSASVAHILSIPPQG